MNTRTDIESHFDTWRTQKPSQTLPLPKRKAQQIQRLRQEIRRLEHPRGDHPIVPIHPELTNLFPAGGLKVGSIYTVSQSFSLIGALIASASAQGSWCALVGMPLLGYEALAALGVNLDRTVLIPNPQGNWLQVVGLLIDVFPLVAVHPTIPPSPGAVSALQARLRTCRSTLLTTANWPAAEGSINLSAPHWHGLLSEHGALSHREVTIQTKHVDRDRSIRMFLPSSKGLLCAPRLELPEIVHKPHQAP